MSTHALIHAPEATQGRYVHYDGYPEHMLGVAANPETDPPTPARKGALVEIIARDGAEGIATLLAHAWSYLDAEAGDRPQERDDITILPGYGGYYTDEDRDGWNGTDDDGALDYSYTLHIDGPTLDTGYGSAR